jgi:hypothetical protein
MIMKLHHENKINEVKLPKFSRGTTEKPAEKSLTKLQLKKFQEAVEEIDWDYEPDD